MQSNCRAGRKELGGESFSYAIVRALAAERDIFAGVAGFSGYGFNVGPPGDSVRKGARAARYRRPTTKHWG